MKQTQKLERSIKQRFITAPISHSRNTQKPTNLKKSIKIKYLSFSGSRTLDYKNVREVIIKEIKKHNPETVVTHGEPAGVCQLVREECKKLGMPLLLFFLEPKYAKWGYYHRTKKVIDLSQYAIFIHDGKSTGTINEMKMAKTKKVPLTYHKIEIDEEWGELEDIKFEDIDFGL